MTEEATCHVMVWHSDYNDVSVGSCVIWGQGCTASTDTIPLVTKSAAVLQGHANAQGYFVKPGKMSPACVVVSHIYVTSINMLFVRCHASVL